MSVKAAAAAASDARHAKLRPAKLGNARYYTTHLSPRCDGLALQIEHGAPAVLEYRDDWLL